MNGGDPWVRTKDGSATPFQLRKKVLQLSHPFVRFSHVSFGMRCFYFYVFVFAVLRDECVSYFRIWHVFLRTTYDG